MGVTKIQGAVQDAATHTVGGIHHREAVMSEKPGLIYGKLINIMRGVGAIPKDKAIQFGGGKPTMVRGIETTMNVLHDLFAKEGVIVITEEAAPEQREVVDGKIITVVHLRFRLIAEDGSEVAGVMRGEGVDHSDKSGSKAVSIATKYFLNTMFLTATTGMDDADNEDIAVNRQSATPPPVEPAPKPAARISSTPDAAGGILTWDRTFPSKYDNAWCKLCGKRHIPEGAPVVNITGIGWSALSCAEAHNAALAAREPEPVEGDEDLPF